MRPRKLRDRRHVRDFNRRTRTKVVSIFKCDQTRLCEMGVGRPLQLLAQLVEVEFAVVRIANRRHHDATQRRRPARLINIRMRLRTEKRLGARARNA